VELIDFQSRDATCAALRDNTLFKFNTSVFQRHLSIWNTSKLCLEATLEAQQTSTRNELG